MTIKLIVEWFHFHCFSINEKNKIHSNVCSINKLNKKLHPQVD